MEQCVSCGKTLGFVVRASSDPNVTNVHELPHAILILGRPEYFDMEIGVEVDIVHALILDKPFAPYPHGILAYCSDDCMHTYTGRKAFLVALERSTDKIIIKYITRELMAENMNVRDAPEVPLMAAFKILGVDIDAIIRCEVREFMDLFGALTQKVDEFL
jgi:hypothetical protein